MITKVAYARLFNLGNYENERIEVEATISADDSLQMWLTTLREHVEAQHAAFEEARAAEAKAAHDRREAEWQRQREEREAQRKAAQVSASEDPF
jgi:hypothetical protein